MAKKKSRAYLCSGDKPDCPKTHCKYNGTGDCRLTMDERYAGYAKPRVFVQTGSDESTIYLEEVRL